ncbi:short-chain dehydrogenase [Enterococcus silesiacus]|uniref:Short-chain dehydrogenase n=1 Tax=Enterococcus silesiacus TaxID=332949 RepID=A0ABN4JDA3_9ENTE|nr:nucleoside-diphosphate sugar epimerase/dehydratase [Enterococcus silesiacus]ALS03315.1 short-chain dehydrogenase [Enterococcus silesiacus]
MSRRTKVLVLLLVDSLIIILANAFSYLYLLPYVKITYFFLIETTIMQLGLYILLGFILKVFTRINRYTNISEMTAIFGATSIVALIELVILAMTDTFYGRRFIVLAYLVTTFFIISSRLSWRLIIEYRNKKGSSSSAAKKTLIIGAGEAGRILLNSLVNSTTNGDIDVVGFIDDAQDKFRTYLGGVRVLGTVDEIPNIVKSDKIEMITVAIPSLQPKELQRILEIITPLGLPINSMPALEEVASGNITISRLKKIDVVDLLGREEVQLDMIQLTDQLTEKIILVTGAGGSIGSEICRQIMKFSPKQLLILGHGENSIYLIERELRRIFCAQDTEIVPIIADIRDRERMFQVIEKYRPETIYHAAAHKHVPLMEENPAEAVKNNVFGTKNVAEAAKEYGVKNFVMISTDKAVNPPNVMGATKRIAEMIVTGLNDGGHTKFCAVRFGNVLGSRGSVIPVFEEQIRAGGPITVTDFRMTRYFMTIPEASRLVIQAGALARGGEMFILDMGEPVKIYDLAKNMIKLSGFREDQIDIIETGIRPGEKLYEELLVSKEKNAEQVFDKIFLGNVKGFEFEKVVSFVSSLSLDEQLTAKEVIKFANESSK